MPGQLIPLRESQLVIEHGIARFSHMAPASLNALSLNMSLDYGEMLDRVEHDPEIRVLIISGSGGSFCAGADLKAVHKLDSPLAVSHYMRALHGILERLRTLGIPVIAAVDGPAYGAGFAIALLCDFVLASNHATFCAPFAKIGLVADCGTTFTLPRIVGLQKAKELLYTARRVPAAEALELGIVHSLYARDALQEQALIFAGRFLAAPRDSMAMTKSLLNKSFETPYATLAELEGQAQGIMSSTAYHIEAVARFCAGEAMLFDG